jgi:hypothetical protein
VGGGGRDLNILVGAVISALGDWLALVPLSLDLQETTDSGIVVALPSSVWSPAILLAVRRVTRRPL